MPKFLSTDIIVVTTSKRLAPVEINHDLIKFVYTRQKLRGAIIYMLI
jgi:hypothetical protein